MGRPSPPERNRPKPRLPPDWVSGAAFGYITGKLFAMFGVRHKDADKIESRELLPHPRIQLPCFCSPPERCGWTPDLSRCSFSFSKRLISSTRTMSFFGFCSTAACLQSACQRGLSSIAGVLYHINSWSPQCIAPYAGVQKGALGSVKARTPRLELL